MSERHWIYENWRAGKHKALLHRASCGRCIDGAGWHSGTDSSNGRWIGPFRRSRRGEGVLGVDAGGSHGPTGGCMLSRPPMSSFTGAPTRSLGLSGWSFKLAARGWTPSDRR